jgi:hypothetical protein
MRTVAVVLAFMCSGCAASIGPSSPPISVSLLNSDFEQLKQDEKTYWEDNARAIDALKAFQRKVEVFKASLTKQEQERFDQFWEKPSQAMAFRIPDYPPDVIKGFDKGEPIPADLGRPIREKISKVIELQNERAGFWKLANSFDEREKDLKARRASLEQQRRDNIAHLEMLAALGDIQQAQEQAQMLNTLLLMTPTPAARAPLEPIITPTFPTPPKRGVITGPGGTYYYREY